MPTHVVKIAGRLGGKGILVTDSADEAVQYVARVLDGANDMVVKVAPAGPPSKPGSGDARPRCEWCRRPGHTVFVTTRRGQAGETGEVTMHNPVLCRVCQGLLCWTGDDGLQDAQEAVIAELCASWRLRSGNDDVDE